MGHRTTNIGTCGTEKTDISMSSNQSRSVKTEKDSDRLCPLNGGDADETGECSRLEQVTDILTSPDQTCHITT